MAQTKFPHVFSPFTIKGVTLRNRFVKMSAAMGLATEDGFVSEDNLAFYETLAKGGVGAIVVEHGFVDYPGGVTGVRRIAINDDKYLPGLKKLADIIRKNGAKSFMQLGHSGPSQFALLNGKKAVSSTTNETPPTRALTIEEIHDQVRKHAEGAIRAKKAGFDGVEIQAAGPYLVNSFLSRAWNRRTDEYGPQDIASRAKFFLEIIRAIRQDVGPDYPVGARMNATEMGMDKGLTLEETTQFAKLAEEAGLDWIGMQAPGYGWYYLMVYPEQLGYPEAMTPEAKSMAHFGGLLPLAEAFKKAVKIPIIAVGGLNAAIGEEAIKNGQADLIGMNRRLFADPNYPNKAAAGKMEEIAPCTACLHCWATQQTGGQIMCRMNPAMGREAKFTVEPAKNKKKIMVVGGGPGGMEAAMLSAQRGHDVTLYDEGGSLGGLIPLAAMIKGTEVEPLPEITRYFKGQMAKAGVKVKLNTAVTPALVESVKPDAVLISTGGIITQPNIPGIEKKIVVSNEYLHNASKLPLKVFGPAMLNKLTHYYLPLGKRVVILGGLLQGVELAEFLIKRKRKVTVLEESGELGTGMHEVNRKKLLNWLNFRGMVGYTNIKIKEVTDKGVKIIDKDGQEKLIEADTVLAAGIPAVNDALCKSLQGKAKEIYIIGDCKGAKTILNAIREGAEISRTI